MKKFVVIYFSDAAAMQKMQSSPAEEMKAEEQNWMNWFKNKGDAVVDMGEYFGQGVQFSQDGQGKPDHDVSGYSIVQAVDFAAAKALLADHPHPQWHEGCKIELFEPMQMK